VSRSAIRTSKLLVVVAAAAVALTLPQVETAAGASTRKVDMRMKGDPGASSPTFKARVTSSTPFGKGTLTGKFRPPLVYYVFKFKRGTFKAKFTGTLSGVKVKGPWKVTSGTGIYKGIKGGGRGSGDLSTGRYHFTGSVRY
jgi:hypothetical protein